MARNSQEKWQRVLGLELFDHNHDLNSPNVMATVMHNPDFVCHQASEGSTT